MPLDHFTVLVPQTKIEDLVTFLTASLNNLGFKEIIRPIPDVVGLGENTTPYFWIAALPEDVEEDSPKPIVKSDHMAFAAESECCIRVSLFKC